MHLKVEVTTIRTGTYKGALLHEEPLAQSVELKLWHGGGESNKDGAGQLGTELTEIGDFPSRPEALPGDTVGLVNCDGLELGLARIEEVIL